MPGGALRDFELAEEEALAYDADGDGVPSRDECRAACEDHGIAFDTDAGSCWCDSAPGWSAGTHTCGVNDGWCK